MDRSRMASDPSAGQITQLGSRDSDFSAHAWQVKSPRSEGSHFQCSRLATESKHDQVLPDTMEEGYIRDDGYLLTFLSS
jgi:hypothetical protein